MMMAALKLLMLPPQPLGCDPLSRMLRLLVLDVYVVRIMVNYIRASNNYLLMHIYKLIAVYI